MKQTRTDIMGMPITIEMVSDTYEVGQAIASAFLYFESIDARFSTYKEQSEIMQINRGEVLESEWSEDMKEVLRLAEMTKQETNGYFDIRTREGLIDPSGMVKGWAIHKVGELLTQQGFANFYVEAGGDIETSGMNADDEPWRVGIRSPFNTQEIVKRIELTNVGIATSGAYIRGAHIYNPNDHNDSLTDVVSLSVIAHNAYEADRFATAGFAMGSEGINFIESLKGLEGYVITRDGQAVFTSNFNQYVI